MAHRGRWAGAFAAALIAAHFIAPLLGAHAPVTLEAQAAVAADPAFWLKAFGTHQTMTAGSPYRALAWQSIGPANDTGRMTSIAVGDKNGSRVIYVGAASGGVWKSEDRGDTWRPVFEHEATASVGDVAVAPSNPDIVWVGTGEDNLFRAGLAGTGIYKSTDAGKTWTHMGLTDSGTIGRILVHPTNPDIVYVAASGHEWTDNEMRGVFMTTDGGKTWTKAFYRSPTTGAVDLVMDPSDPNTLYAGMWQRARRKWSDPRVEPGYSEGGIWKTTDGGKTWKAVNDGLTPARVSRSCRDRCVAVRIRAPSMPVIDSYEQGRPVRSLANETRAAGRCRRAATSSRDSSCFDPDDKGGSWEASERPDTGDRRRHDGPRRHLQLGLHADSRRSDGREHGVRAGAQHQQRVARRRGDASLATPHPAATIIRMWIDPDPHPLTTYIAHDGGFTMTDDGGWQTRKSARGINGTQFYNVEVDNATPFHIYGSVQDTGSHRVALDVSHGWSAIAPLNWDGAPGGEGSNQAIDPANPNIVYSHGYYGNFSRADYGQPVAPSPAARAGGSGAGGGAARPGAPGGGRGRDFTSPNIRPPDQDLRAQWMAPIIVSQFDHQTIYAGYQYLLRSHDRGGTWEKISAVLTSNDPKQMGINPSAIPYQTLTQIAESPKRQGLLYVGTDDGHLWLTRDDGKTWTELTASIPMGTRKWVSRIVPSRTDEGTVYVAERGREDDDFAPYLWKSTDDGKTWKSIVGNIPAGSINVIREDPAVPNLLYAGNDFGVYVSTDGGAKWNVLGGNLPTNEVSDIQIQARDNVIVAATYGRGMFVMDATKVRAIK